MQVYSWANFIPDLQQQLPLDYENLKKVRILNKHWNRFAQRRILELISENQDPIERLGISRKNIRVLIQRNPSALTSFSSVNRNKTENFSLLELCTNLRCLDVSNWNVRLEDIQKICKTLGSTSLTSFNLGPNVRLFGDFSIVCSNLTSLKHLNITPRTTVPVELTHLLNPIVCFLQLSSLIMENTFITQESARLLASATSLKELNLNNGVLGNEHANGIFTSLTNLQSLKVNENNLDWGCLDSIYRLTALTEFEIGFNYIRQEDWIPIASRLPSLRVLDVSFRSDARHNDSTPTLDHFATTLTNLTSLSLGNWDINLKALEVLGRMTRLQSLKMVCSLYNPDYVKKISNLKQLRYIRLMNCALTAPGIEVICQSFPRLESLLVIFNRIGKVGAMTIANSSLNLRELSIGGDFEIDDEAILAIIRKMPNLTSLITGGHRISDEVQLTLRQSFNRKGTHLILDDSQ